MVSALVFGSPAAAQEPAPAPAEAEEPAADTWDPSVALHGFGTWTYGKTDGNQYLFGSEEGDYAHSEFSLNIAAAPLRRLSIRAQVALETDEQGTETVADYAFAEWRFSDGLRARFGQAQHPFGLYSEIFDVGTLRPFVSLPQSVYGPVGIFAESYKGIGLTGYRQSAGGWGLGYDLYVGGLDVVEQDAIAILGGAENHDVVRNVVGGRISLKVPATDLTFGLAALQGTNEGNDNSRNSSIGVQVQYLSDDWWVRSEAIVHDDRGERRLKAGYLEVSRFLTPHWQVAGRYDRLTTDLTVNEESLPLVLFQHREVALGVNYWFSSSLVLKLSIHDVEGDAFALPDEAQDLREALAGGGLDPATRLLAFGAQFTF
jgi:hypothetical protein